VSAAGEAFMFISHSSHSRGLNPSTHTDSRQLRAAQQQRPQLRLSLPFPCSCCVVCSYYTQTAKTSALTVCRLRLPVVPSYSSAKSIALWVRRHIAATPPPLPTRVLINHHRGAENGSRPEPPSSRYLPLTSRAIVRFFPLPLHPPPRQ